MAGIEVETSVLAQCAQCGFSWWKREPWPPLQGRVAIKPHVATKPKIEGLRGFTVSLLQ
jgi:hypothetical protein